MSILSLPMGNRDDSPPPWLSESIHASVLRPALRDQARQAAEDGLALAKLGAERERVGFVALPFGKYLQGLAKLAEVSWDTVCRIAGVDLLVLDEATAYLIGRFGADLGFDFRSLRAHIRVGLAEAIEEAPVPVFVAYRGKGRSPDSLIECEVTLFDMESEWEEQERLQVRQIEELTRNGFLSDNS